ncbi:biliverdin-producing heme oxygenase [Leucobacter ruminantium]|uniref:Biliverdin-producing heme oxygenase n=1 Tax=Leucobacter ruminantium TaxID=1289170 RepID=A0A939LY71_9MICO|nr:biliverdin-producing heme oxygenase [Leucobacter ruminantium]MBO1805123.1 biliverdin-producing heme oxygenase [Leucobacter ruminantium]
MNFGADVVAGVTGHMNGDHSEDNLLIARAFGYPGAMSSEMIGVNGEAGVWRVSDDAGEHELSVPWPGGSISERPQIRREVVALYRAACERLGVEPRQEHGSAPAVHAHGEVAHGEAAHSEAGPRAGHGRHAAGDEGSAPSDGSGQKPFSRVLREGSWSDHSDSEGATFMEDIMRGRGSLADYVDLVAQHYFMYEALEEAAAKVADDPAFTGFHSEALVRLPALEADLAHLIGPDWRERISAVPATEAYAARMREVGDEGWVAGVVAHHYTRYLGDLSGGQFIAKRVARQHELQHEGIAFYDFSELGSLTEFKDGYRAELDRLGASLSAEEQARMLDEVRAAYAFNTAVFVDLGRAKANA